MSQSDEPWVRAATSNVNVVAEILMRLHEGSSHLRPPTNPKPLNWTVRQRRSKLTTSSKKPKTHHLSSPTTPLSWSAGSEESARSHVHVSTAADPARSNKACNEGSEKAASKRPRKRKTLAELRDEESSLLKEGRELKREIAALRANLEEQRAANGNLKRMKVLYSKSQNGLQQRLSGYGAACGPDESSVPLRPNEPPPMITSKDDDTSLKQSSSSKASSSCKRFVVIPDLNDPFEEDEKTEVLLLSGVESSMQELMNITTNVGEF